MLCYETYTMFRESSKIKNDVKIKNSTNFNCSIYIRKIYFSQKITIYFGAGNCYCKLINRSEMDSSSSKHPYYNLFQPHHVMASFTSSDVKPYIEYKGKSEFEHIGVATVSSSY